MTERSDALALWGGVECTVNRVGDTYMDQLARTGHDARISDLDLVASLGVKALRYPVLWERHADRAVSERFAWAQARIARIRALGIRPIVGLLHHGSGPPDTDLLDPAFPEKLARYARDVAEALPFVDAFTPVNEPLTTARFSALYGHWYPHRRDDRDFATALLNQCRGVALAMRAIREVIPHAELVQTDDLGHVRAVPALARQAAFENERRWLAFDLLMGRVDRAHPLWERLRCAARGEALLEAMHDEPCPPDVVGLNYYVTSERFLDDRLDRHPPRTHGGNGRDVYADVEAVRACKEGLVGPRALLRQAYARFGRPVAITEAHLGCHREEQLRWLHEVFHQARAARDEDGVDVRAVTVWALFGSYDWHTLLTRDEGRYETGVFDARCSPPRPTALASLARDLAHGTTTHHPLVEGDGWWRRDVRLATRTEARVEAGAPRRSLMLAHGDDGLARAFLRACALRNIRCVPVDAATEDTFARALDHADPWAVVDLTGHALQRVVHPVLRDGTNVRAERIARRCAAARIPLLTFSSDLVFDGSKASPYDERDAPSPDCGMGYAVAHAEERVRHAHAGALVVRTNGLFCADDDESFLSAALHALQRGETVLAPDDVIISVAHLPELAHACLDLLVDAEEGIIHLVNDGWTSPFTLLERAASMTGTPVRTLTRTRARGARPRSRRARYCALDTVRTRRLPTLSDALGAYAATCGAACA